MPRRSEKSARSQSLSSLSSRVCRHPWHPEQLVSSPCNSGSVMALRTQAASGKWWDGLTRPTAARMPTCGCSE